MSFLKSFKYAWSGIKKAFLTGRNFRVMTICFVIVVLSGLFFGVSVIEWVILLICSGGVLSLEIINTAIEKAVDLAVSSYNDHAGDAKDMAAGAALVASIFSVVIALMIFLPYIIGAMSL